MLPTLSMSRIRCWILFCSSLIMVSLNMKELRSFCTAFTCWSCFFLRLPSSFRMLSKLYTVSCVSSWEEDAESGMDLATASRLSRKVFGCLPARVELILELTMLFSICDFFCVI